MSANDKINSSKGIILFDGVCNFCNSSINFTIKHDPEGKFKFAPLQSEYAKKALGKTEDITPESVVLIQNNNVYYKSDAALRISKQLSGIWPLMYVFIIIPKPIRNWVYDLIAKNRYKWFGKMDTCMIPTPAVRARFIE